MVLIPTVNKRLKTAAFVAVFLCLDLWFYVKDWGDSLTRAFFVFPY